MRLMGLGVRRRCVWFLCGACLGLFVLGLGALDGEDLRGVLRVGCWGCRFDWKVLVGWRLESWRMVRILVVLDRGREEA